MLIKYQMTKKKHVHVCLMYDLSLLWDFNLKLVDNEFIGPKHYILVLF